MPIVELTLSVELLEHFGLVGLGLDFQPGQGDDDPLVGLLPGGDL